MSEYRLTLLGAFACETAEGAPIRIETRKARALLAMLAMARGRPMARERLAGLLWSRGTTRQSLASLSQALYSLRRALPEPLRSALAAEGETVALKADGLRVDALDLEDAARDGQESRCLALYGGPFLDDLPIEAEEGFADWRQAERARLEALASAAGTALMRRWEAAPGAADAALVERLLGIDPYNEPALRVKMHGLAAEGRPGAAIEAATAFVARLDTDLGILPSDELTALANRIRAGGIAPTGQMPAPGPRSRLARIAAAVVAVVLLAGSIWALLPRDAAPPHDAIRLLVRPFQMEAGGPPELAQGFSDDLATELVRRTGLEVLSRESGRLLPEGREVEIGASHVLGGRLRSTEERWVLNLWITELATGRDIWASRFEGDARDPLALRDTAVARLADRIGAALHPAVGPPVLGLPGPAVPAYLRGLAQLHSGTAEGNAAAIAAMQALASAHPEAPEPAAALVLAYGRVAFGADAHARAAGLHWREGYLLLKQTLAAIDALHPGLLAAQARLALRRRDFAEAERLARRALEIEASHVPALEVLAKSLALRGETGAAREAAIRAVTLSPAAPSQGQTALSLAAFAEGDLDAAAAAAALAVETAGNPPLELLVLRAALAGLGAAPAAAQDAFADLVGAVESRPYGAWRVGDIAYTNPRAATWRRPSAADAAALVGFAAPAAQVRLARGLARAAGEGPPSPPVAPAVLDASEIARLVMGRRITGPRGWLADQGWSQTRDAEGRLAQEGAFGPLPAAQSGRSRVENGRLCDRWVWHGQELEACHLVMRTGAMDSYAMVGETGTHPFAAAPPSTMRRE